MNQSEELRMTYSGIITKKGQKIVHVFFERGKDYAEGSLPVSYTHLTLPTKLEV